MSTALLDPGMVQNLPLYRSEVIVLVMDPPQVHLNTMDFDSQGQRA